MIANLYVFCSSVFKETFNLIQHNHEEIFLVYYEQYKRELRSVSDDIFDPDDFSKIIGILEKVNDSKRDEFLISIWAYLKSIDWMVPDEKIFFNTKNCQSSDYFDSHKYLLLFKPRNLIFETIKEKFFEDKIKNGSDIGQRIGDHLQNLILYDNLSPYIEIKAINRNIDQLLLDKGTDLAFRVAPIHYDFEYSFLKVKEEGDRDGVPYIFGEIKNRKKISTAILNVLEKCKKEDVHIVVFPELSIDEELRNDISEWLREKNTEKTIIMVVAGSYHIYDKKRDRYENKSIVFGYDGVPLWEQKKMNRVELDENDINGFLKSTKKGFKDFKKLFTENDKKGWEDIEGDNVLIIHDSSIGRMAITICIDYFVKEKVKLLIEPNVNMIFVPSMSPTLDKFVNSNFDLGTYARASVFCANSCWVITGGECEGDEIKYEDSSYIYIPIRNGRVHMNCSSKCNCLKCNPLVFRVSEIQEFLEKNN